MIFPADDLKVSFIACVRALLCPPHLRDGDASNIPSEGPYRAENSAKKTASRSDRWDRTRAA